jgi:Holliday junction resolvase-like predicted endonuclease
MSAARQEFGEEGERVAERWLRQRGWRVLHGGFGTATRDIDLVAEKDGNGGLRGGEGTSRIQFGDPVAAVDWRSSGSLPGRRRSGSTGTGAPTTAIAST